jgi:uncharacterized protein (DUF697 family)
MADSASQTENNFDRANRMIRNHVIGAAVVGIVPIPLVDLAALIGIQVNLVRCLAKIYNLPFSREIGKSLIGALVGATLPLAALGVLRAIPPLAIVSSVTLAGASTAAVGKIFAQHFESGGTMLNFDPEKVRAHYAAEVRKQAEAMSLKSLSEEDDYGGIQP